MSSRVKSDPNFLKNAWFEDECHFTVGSNKFMQDRKSFEKCRTNKVQHIKHKNQGGRQYWVVSNAHHGFFYKMLPEGKTLDAELHKKYLEDFIDWIESNKNLPEDHKKNYILIMDGAPVMSSIIKLNFNSIRSICNTVLDHLKWAI